MHTQPAAYIWAQLHDDLLRYVRGKVSNLQDAEDLLQEVFIKIILSAKVPQKKSEFKPWVFAITRNRVIDYYRKARLPMQTLEQEQLEAQAGEDLPLSEVALHCLAQKYEDNAELVDRIRNEKMPREELLSLMAEIEPFFGELSDDYAEALVYVYFKGYSQKELATHLGISYSGAKSRVQRATAKLRQLIDACCRAAYDSRGTIIDFIPHSEESACASGNDCHR